MYDVMMSAYLFLFQFHIFFDFTANCLGKEDTLLLSYAPAQILVKASKIYSWQSLSSSYLVTRFPCSLTPIKESKKWTSYMC